MNIFNKTIAAVMLFTSLFVMSCGKDETTTNHDTAKIMLIHASPDAPSIDVYDDTAKLNSVVISYTDVIHYLSIFTGNKALTIKQVISGTTIFSTSSFSFIKNKSYSLFIVDSLSKISNIFLEDNLATPATGKTNFRILHLSPNTQNVDFILRSGTDSIAITNRTFKQIPDLLAIDGKTYTIRVKATGTENILATATGVVLSSGRIYTLFLKGFSGGIGSTALGIEQIANN